MNGMTLSSETITSTIPREEAVEVQAFASLFKAARPALPSTAFAYLPLGGGLAISLPEAPAYGLNRILGVTDRRDLDRAYDWMQPRGGNRVLQINESTAAPETKAWLSARGLVGQGPRWAKLRRSADLLPPATGGSHVRARAVGEQEADLFGDLMCAGFGFPEALRALWSSLVGQPGWSCFVADVEGRPAATGAIFISGGFAWLGGGATLPEFRNHGAQKALISARLRHGIAQGVTSFAVETQEPAQDRPNVSHANLLKLGFTQIYARSNMPLP